MNKKYLIIFILIALIVAAIFFVATNNIIIAVAILGSYIVTSIFVIIPKLVQYDKAVVRFHECFHFINNFIITLSIKKTISASLENTSLSMSDDFKEMFDALENMNDDEKLKYLSGTYFTFHVYQLFLQVVDLFIDQGGDILQMSKYLLEECRLNEDYVNATHSITIRKYFEVSTLWVFSLTILILLRFALKEFYEKLSVQPLYYISLGVVALFILVSIIVLVFKGTKLNLKGYRENEKII